MSHLAEVFPSDEYSNREMWREYLPHVARIRANAIEEHVEGKGKPYWWIGRCSRVDGKIKEAVHWLEESCQLETEIEENHPDRLALQHALALAYQANGQVKEAVQLLELVVVRL
jgi:hypothetical protein